ncbi:MAG: hypothetical protein ACYDB2_10330 [Acidimicrobiales bacterium]
MFLKRIAARKHAVLRAVLISAFLVPAYVGTASAGVSPTIPNATAADQSISLASPQTAIARAAVDIFGPNGSYLQNPALNQQVATAYGSLSPAAQQAIKTDVLSVSKVTSYTVPAASVVANASSCGYSILYNRSENIFGWVLILWSVQVNGCSNGSTVSNDFYFPAIEELSWGWGFSQYATQYGHRLTSSDYEAYVNAIFTVGEYNIGFSRSQGITVDVYGNGSASGSCSGGNAGCYW